MGNDNPQELLTDAESEMVSEEPPNREDYLDRLDAVFDGIDAVELLADAEIYFSAFLLRTEIQMACQQKSHTSTFVFEDSLGALVESQLDLLSDEEVLCYLQAEGINCEQFICRTMEVIKGNLIA
jgi:hypothetical protein